MNFTSVTLGVIHAISLGLLGLSVFKFFKIRKERCDQFIPLGSACKEMMRAGTLLVWLYIVAILLISIGTAAYFVTLPDF